MDIKRIYKFFTAPVLETGLVQKEIASPSNPPAGYHKVFMKSDGKVYTLNSAGVETDISTSGGGSDILHTVLYNQAV